MYIVCFLLGMKNDLSYLPAYEDETDRVFRNVGTHISDAGELPKRKHTAFRTRRKFEIKICIIFHYFKIMCAKCYIFIFIVRRSESTQIVLARSCTLYRFYSTLLMYPSKILSSTPATLLW
jgi:hypothetical protein